MNVESKSIRPFVGSKDYAESRRFYKVLGFTELEIGPTMCFFKISESLGFYLQKAYVKDWVDNTMLFWEVADVEEAFSSIKDLKLPTKFSQVRLSKIIYNDWGSEFFLHDPSEVLWHIGTFNTMS